MFARAVNENLHKSVSTYSLLYSLFAYNQADMYIITENTKFFVYIITAPSVFCTVVVYFLCSVHLTEFNVLICGVVVAITLMFCEVAILCLILWLNLLSHDCLNYHSFSLKF